MDTKMMELLQQQMLLNSGGAGAADSPMAALLNNMIQEASTRNNDKDGESGAPIQLERLRRSRDKWKSYAKGLAETVNYFAGLLGACPLCFNTDETCAHCNGAAMGEVNPPHMQELIELVGPLLESQGYEITYATPPSTNLEEIQHA